MTKEGSAKTVNFMTPGAGVLVLGRGHICISLIVNMCYVFKNLLLYSRAWMRQSEYILMMTKERSTKIVDFMTSRAGILVTERGSISHYAVKMHYFSSLLLDIDDTNYVYSHDDLGWVYQICRIP